MRRDLDARNGLPPPLLYSYASAARELDVTAAAVRAWARRGLIRTVRVGRLPRIPLAELERIASTGTRRAP